MKNIDTTFSFSVLNTYSNAVNIRENILIHVSSFCKNNQYTNIPDQLTQHEKGEIFVSFANI